MNLSMYAPIEQAILAKYFHLPAPPGTTDLDLWEVDPRYPDAIVLEAPESGYQADEISNAVARIALSHVQHKLPQFLVLSPEKIETGRTITLPLNRTVEPLPHYLFTINWAMTAPGLGWPETYFLTWLPGVERWVVTSSSNTPEAHGYCDLVIGHFDSGTSPLAGVHHCLIDFWSGMARVNQDRWAICEHEGYVSCDLAYAWQDEVWGIPEEPE